MYKGIDVSFAQGNINWNIVKTDFAVIRAGYGKAAFQKDAQFENNYSGCKSNNIPVGTYWFSYAVSEAEAVEEAKACLEVINGKIFEYPVYFDIEENKQLSMGMEKCSAVAETFLDYVEKAGYWVGIYSYKNALEGYISERIRKRYAVWVAQYSNECTYIGDYGIWQYSSTGKINGISGNVDTDYCYVNYPALIKAKGLNGFKKPDESKILDASGFRKGDRGDGVLALKCLLLTAKRLGINRYSMDENGVFGDGTLNAVNYMLERWGYDKTGTAGQNFIGKLYGEIKKKV